MSGGAGVWRPLAALLVSYLIGAVPFALVVGRVFYHVDVRDHGSGNLGATNVYRVLGIRAGIATALLDIAKGAVAVLVARAILEPAYSGARLDWLLVGAGILAMLGHSYTVYARFKGGKGVATAAGVLLVLTPWALAVLLSVFVLIVIVTRYVSLGSVIVAAAYPFVTWLLYGARPALVAFATAGALLVLWRHRSNIARLSRREEPRIEWKSGGIRGRIRDARGRRAGGGERE